MALTRLPGNIVLNGSEVDNMTHIPNKGVIVKNRFGHILGFIREADNVIALHYFEELLKFVEALANKAPYTMNFELPSSEQAKQEQPKKFSK
tara:strand:+ start:13859 stop:14134 length:276 start_codon:yes stop_codon:yes gene_type:complete